MGRYVARRLLQMIPVFLGATLIIFMMVYTLPGDPVRLLWGDQTVDPAQIAQKRHELGLDLPLWQQYVNYMFGLLQGDFGEQISTGRPVSEILANALPVTLRLTVIAVTLVIAIGVPMGVFSGLKIGKLVDRTTLIFTLLIISVPIFVSGYVLQTLFAIKLEWTTPTVQDSTAFSELLLPGFVLALLSLANISRLSRTSIAENLRADYVRTAIAKGLPRRRVVGRHLLRNSLIPVVTYIGIDFGSLMGGAIVTERIFNVQGVGGAIFGAITAREGSTVVGLVTVLILVYLFVNLIVDLLYAVLDPRIRYV
jgi:oligopeptide transport system permease protein